MTIGAGRIISRIYRIDDAVADKSLHTLPQLDRFNMRSKASQGTAHVMALISLAVFIAVMLISWL